MDVADKFVRSRRDNREGANPLTRFWPLPVFPNASECERFATLHPDGIGLLGRDALNRLPLEEVINRHEAAAALVGVTKARERRYCLRLGVYRLSTTIDIFAPIGNESPPKRVECARQYRGVDGSPNALGRANSCSVAGHATARPRRRC